MENKIQEEEKLSEFIARHTIESDKGKQINMIGVVTEMYARIKALQNQVMDTHKALGDYGKFSLEVEERLEKLEGKKKIHLVTDEASIKKYS